MNNDHIYNLLTELQKTVLQKAVEPENHDQIRFLMLPESGKPTTVPSSST